VWLDSLDVDDYTRQRLAALSPRSYIGLAVEITDLITTAAVNADIKAPKSYPD
jgi:hypothetical protein